MRNSSDVHIFKHYLATQDVVKGANIPLFVDLKKTPVTNYLMTEAFYRGQQSGLKWITSIESDDINKVEKKIKGKLLDFVVVHGSVILTQQRIINDLSGSYIRLQDKVEAERLQPEMGKSLDAVEALGYQSVLYWVLGII